MTRFYSIYSLTTSISAWPALSAAIHARLEPFACETAASCALSLSFESVPPRRSGNESTGGRPVYDFPDGLVSYDDARDVLTVAAGDRIRVHCEPATGCARVEVESPQPSDLYLLSHPILSLLIMELLKRRGHFPVHAAGLALGDRGVLLAGTSGAGKSTLAVALARRGFSFLSDDTVFLSPDASGWRVRAFPDQVDLCADAPELFPELHQAGREDLPPGWRKRQIRAETLYETAICWEVSPRVLIFPAVSGAATSRLRPLSAPDALLELVPNVLLTDADGSQQHLNALAGLAGQCACYRLDTGRDLDDAVAIVREAVA